MATDLMMSLKISCPAQVIQEGSLTLPAKQLAQLLKEMTHSQIELRLIDDKEVLISAGSSQFKLPMMAGNLYPHFPEIEHSFEFDISQNSLKTLLYRSAFSCAKDPTQHVLNGLQMRCEGNRLTIISTDSKRISRLSIQGEFSFESKIDLIIPLRAVDEMIKMIDSSDEQLHVMVNQDRFMIKTSSYQFITQLICGKYPDVERVIPTSESNSIVLHREELMSLLKQVSLFTNETNRSVRFTFDHGALHLSAVSDKAGTGHVSMPIDFTGEPFQTAYNPSYVLDILRHTEDETIQFRSASPYTPGLIKDSTEATFIIMPLRLDPV
jgi:DNA polymerase-3 subunit beta